MRIFFDTEFIDDGRTIDLISIGLVREDGAEYYAESAEANLAKACPWVRENVIAKLVGGAKPRAQIAAEIVEFVGVRPEFWAYYAAYDWVAISQLYGRMLDVPPDWPNLPMDIKVLAILLGNPTLPVQEGGEHNALEDARWNKLAWQALADITRRRAAA